MLFSRCVVGNKILVDISHDNLVRISRRTYLTITVSTRKTKSTFKVPMKSTFASTIHSFFIRTSKSRSRLGVLNIFKINIENTWWSSLFLNFTLYHYSNSEAGIVLRLFLIFRDFEPRCSYKIVLIKKKECIDSRSICAYPTCGRSLPRKKTFLISSSLISFISSSILILILILLLLLLLILAICRWWCGLTHSGHFRDILNHVPANETPTIVGGFVEL